MAELIEKYAALLISGGIFGSLVTLLIAWWSRRKVAAEAHKADAEAHRADAEAEAAHAQAVRTIAESSQITGDQYAKLIAAQDARINELVEMRAVDNARQKATEDEVDNLKRQQGINMATIAALNAQNASTLKMNNDLLLENRLLHQRIGQLETELGTERHANMLMQQKVKSLEARIAELEARQPTGQ